jgi:hypothetical protein
MPLRGDQRRTGIKAETVFHAVMLVFELFRGQKVAHDKRHLGPYNVRAHAMFVKVLPGLNEVGGKLSRPGPEVLYVGKNQVH